MDGKMVGIYIRMTKLVGKRTGKYNWLGVGVWSHSVELLLGNQCKIWNEIMEYNLGSC